jgi:DNA polymerase-3 subunit beta
VNITTNRAALNAALRISASTSGDGSGHAQLACVLLRAAAGKLTVSSTDLTTTSVIEIPCVGTGSASIGAANLSAIVGTLDADEVSISVDGGTATVRGGKRKNQVPTIGRPEDFPRLPDVDGAVWQAINGHALGEVIDAVKSACALDPARAAMCGVNLRAGGGVIVGAATDGKRLHRVERSTDANFAAGTVPLNACKVVASVCDDEMFIARDASSLMVRCRDVTIVVRLIVEPFPDFTQVIPVKNARIVTVDRKDMTDALARAKMVTGKEHKDTGALPVVIEASGTEAHLSSRNKDGFVADDTLDAEHSGKPIKVALSPDFVVAAMKAMGSERVTLRCESELSAVMVHRAGETVTPTSGDYAVIMPMDVR